METQQKILVTGGLGQLGMELCERLCWKFGDGNVIVSDIRDKTSVKLDKGLRYERLDVTDKAALLMLVRREQITQVYHLAAVLSAKGESDPQGSWQLNMEGLLNVLDVCQRCNVQRVFYPSSIAVFGPEQGKVSVGQVPSSVPTTVYGMSKLSGEYWCQYYFEKFGLDVRSIRFPGLIGHKAFPGGGTTDYAVDIFYKAKRGLHYQCFLRADATLPMMFMDDAIRAITELMEADPGCISVRTSYNLSALSFSPAELADGIRQRIPDFRVSFVPDFRQGIADSWPASLNDRKAREDWGWRHHYGMDGLIEAMLRYVDVGVLPV